MIDLHSHTNESDGTASPAQLVEEACGVGVTILGITDHDTFAGYDRALPRARETGLELICGIELSTKLQGQTAHLLGYFLRGDPPAEFRTWVLEMQTSRRDRNLRLVERMRELGFDITLADLESRARGMTGRLHLAQLMVEKGYAASVQQAFDDYLGESGRLTFTGGSRSLRKHWSASGRPEGLPRWRTPCVCRETSLPCCPSSGMPASLPSRRTTATIRQNKRNCTFNAAIRQPAMG